MGQLTLTMQQHNGIACINEIAFTLDANNSPAGFSGYSFQGLKIS